MISDSTKIILQLSDPFDYNSYCVACDTAGIGPVTIGQFYQTAGMLEGAKRRNEADPEQGYLDIVREMNTAFAERKQVLPQMVNQPESRDCGGCGGGRVR